MCIVDAVPPSVGWDDLLYLKNVNTVFVIAIADVSS